MNQPSRGSCAFILLCRFPKSRARTIALALAIAVTLAATAAPLPGASFRLLGEGTIAHAVSADGTTVVGARGPWDSSKAFRWTASGGFVDLEAQPGGAFRVARAVSADGSVIVGDGGENLVRWTSSGGAAFHGRVYSATGVSADGTVVVGGMAGGFAGGNGVFHDNPPLAYRWTAQAGITFFGALGTWERDGSFRMGSQANGISADGSVIVGWSTSAELNGAAFRWTAASGMVPLGGGSATAVSADGSVVVGWQERIATGTGSMRAFRWTENSGMVAIVPQRDADSVARAVSGDGSVVVGAHRVPHDTGESGDAFIWDSSRGMRSLEDALTNEYGLDLEGVDLLDARGISADGRVIVGQAISPTGGVESFVAVVPEPAGMALLAVAGAALLGRRRPGRRSRCSICAGVAVVACAAPALAVVSSNGGPNPPFSGVDINRHVGAERFYSNGYTGTRAVAGVVEATHFWTGHETLSHVTTLIKHPDITLPNLLPGIDHKTAVGSVLGGRPGGRNPQPWQRGIAYGADLWSGAVATRTIPPAGFGWTDQSFHYAYDTMLIGGVGGRTADVVSTSFTDNGDRNNRNSRILDSLARGSGRTLVMAAGNSGNTGLPQPGSFARGFNNIAAASLGTDTSSPVYGSRSWFSSYGPSDFWNPATGAVVPRAVASIDLAAPGENLTVAGYPGSPQGRSDYYRTDAGTSFAAPIVAGGAALVVDAGRALFPDNPHATDGRVVKSVLQNSATKLPGWSNAANLLNGVRTSRQGLDYFTGAGALNLGQAYTQYTAGTTDVPGLGGGAVQPVGWDFGEVGQGEPVDYFFSTPLRQNTRLTATLNWFLDNSYDFATDTLIDQSLDNLDLEVWRLTPGEDVADVLLAQSISAYNNVEHLHFQLPETADYMLRVKWTGEVFDTVNDANRESFALSWSGTPVPEPAAMSLLAAAFPMLLGGRRRRRQSL